MDELDSFSAQSELCKVGYSKERLENSEHTIVIETVGPSPQAPETSEGGLDVASIMLVVLRTFSHNIWGVDFLPNDSVTSEEPLPEDQPSPSGMPRWVMFLQSITNCYVTMTNLSLEELSLESQSEHLSGAFSWSHSSSSA